MNLTLITSCLAMGALVCLSACSQPVHTNQGAFQHGEDSIRLRNEAVEVVVVPATGRIMSYRMLEGPEMLWRNPKVSDTDTQPFWGGAVTWAWPQNAWKEKWGSWPPPAAWDNMPHTILARDGSSITLESPIEPHTGLKIQHRIALDPDDSASTRVQHEYTLIKAAEGEHPPMAVWSVTPMSSTPVALLRLVMTEGSSQTYKRMNSSDWKAIETRGRCLRLVPNNRNSAKVGAEADRIVLANNNVAMIYNHYPQKNAPGAYEPCERAQFFVEPPSADPKKAMSDYLEVEFTSPRAPLTKIGDSVSLRTSWELVSLPAEYTEDDLFKLLDLQAVNKPYWSLYDEQEFK